MAMLFKDHPQAPTMIVIPAGRFVLGESEAGAPDGPLPTELRGALGPPQDVTVAHRFGLAQLPVTRAMFSAFMAGQSDYRIDPGAFVWRDDDWVLDANLSWQNPGFDQSDQDPVVCACWDDAIAYTHWLTALTSRLYRLPSEAEWEYACRAGTTTIRWWGDEITPNQANYGDRIGRTVPADGHAANAFGLCGMLGNAWEWCADAWNPSHADLPAAVRATGSARETGQGGYRVLKGGSWGNIAGYIRCAARLPSTHLGRNPYDGFRVACDLPGDGPVAPHA